MSQFDFYHFFVQTVWLIALFLTAYALYTRFYIKNITEVRMLRQKLFAKFKAVEGSIEKSSLYNFILDYFFRNKK